MLFSVNSSTEKSALWINKGAWDLCLAYLILSVLCQQLNTVHCLVSPTPKTLTRCPLTAPGSSTISGASCLQRGIEGMQVIGSCSCLSGAGRRGQGCGLLGTVCLWQRTRSGVCFAVGLAKRHPQQDQGVAFCRVAKHMIKVLFWGRRLYNMCWSVFPELSFKKKMDLVSL